MLAMCLGPDGDTGLYKDVVPPRAIGGSEEQRSHQLLSPTSVRRPGIVVVVQLAGVQRSQLCLLRPSLPELRALAYEGLEHKGRERLLLILHRRLPLAARGHDCGDMALLCSYLANRRLLL